MSDAVLVAREAGIATVTLNRPHKLNALDLAMWDALAEAMTVLTGDQSVRVIVVTGAGEAFAAGADLAEFSAVRTTPEAAKAYNARMNRALSALREAPQPTVAAIRGACAGAGLEIAVLCDIRLAAESSRFGAPIQRLGVTMPFPEIGYLVELLGRAVTLEILLEGRMFAAAEALQKGIVSRVLADSDFAQEVAATARRLAEGAPLVHRWHKRFTRRCLDPRPLSEAEFMEGFASVATEDYREGVRAFLAKEKPKFRGR